MLKLLLCLYDIFYVLIGAKLLDFSGWNTLCWYNRKNVNH